MPDYSLVRIPTSPNWYVQWFEDGHSRRVTTRTRSDVEAKAFLAAFTLAALDTPAADLTVGAVLDWYWDSHGQGVMRPDGIELSIRYLKPFLEKTLCSALTIEKQEHYVAHRKALGAGSESIRRDLSTLSAATRRAVKYKKLDRAPPVLSLTPNAPRERWLTRGEVARLLRQMRKPVRGKIHRHVILFSRLALYTGARTGAILDLTWDRVDFANGLIDFRKPGRRVTKKRRGVKPMTKKLRRMLLHAYRRSSSAHVISWAGERIDRVAKSVNAAADAAGIDGFSPHIFRHTFASWAVQRRVSIYLVGKALDQTVASTTERYAKLAPDDVLEAMERSQRK